MATSSRSAERFKYGICLNDECPLCKEKKVQQIPMRKELVCSECGKPLRECPPPGGGGPNWKRIGIIAAAVVAVAGAGYGLWSLVGGSSDPLDKIAKIELSKEKVTLLVGGKSKTVKATAVDKDGKEIKDAKVTYQWAVDNSDIATVTQKGEIAAVKEGDATVTVTIDGQKQGVSATCTVKVKDAPSGNPIEKISIKDAKDFTLKKGGTKKLEYKAEPADHSESPEWESSNPDVATIDDNGMVTAVKKGSAIISIKAQAASSQVTVTVEDDTTPPPVNPPYGRYTGDRNAQGQPHGFGDVVFTKRKLVISSTYAEPGYIIRNARFVNGKLQSGTLYDTDGNKVCFIDANNNL